MIKIIFDRSLQTGKLPADWMKANVMPMFKKGDKSQIYLSRLHSLQGPLPTMLAQSWVYINDLPDEVRPE